MSFHMQALVGGGESIVLNLNVGIFPTHTALSSATFLSRRRSRGY